MQNYSHYELNTTLLLYLAVEAGEAISSLSSSLLLIMLVWTIYFAQYWQNLNTVKTRYKWEFFTSIQSTNQLYISSLSQGELSRKSRQQMPTRNV